MKTGVNENAPGSPLPDNELFSLSCCCFNVTPKIWVNWRLSESFFYLPWLILVIRSIRTFAPIQAVHRVAVPAVSISTRSEKSSNRKAYNRSSASGEDAASLGAIAAHFNLTSRLEQRLPELMIGITIPDFPERIFFQVAQHEKSIFIEATRDYFPVPGYNATMPHPPAAVVQAVFHGVRAVRIFPIP